MNILYKKNVSERTHEKSAFYANVIFYWRIFNK